VVQLAGLADDWRPANNGLSLKHSEMRNQCNEIV
jgi:hypothetical protein